MDETLPKNVTELIEKLKEAAMAESNPEMEHYYRTENIQDMASPSSSEFSKSILSEVPPSSSENPLEESKDKVLPDHSQDLFGSRMILDSEPSFDDNEDLGVEYRQSVTEMNEGGRVLNTESEEYDFSLNTYEGHHPNHLMEIEIPNIHKYTTNRDKSPFSAAKRTLI